MLGTTVTVKHIDGTDVDLAVPAGSLHGQRLSCKGLGFKHMKFTNVRGDLHVILNIKTPRVTDPKLIEEIKSLAAKLKRK
jgi:DnaJ-class molecular chaperone